MIFYQSFKPAYSRLFLAIFTALFLLVGLSLAVNFFGMFQSFDTGVLQFLYTARLEWLTKLFLVFTFFGSEEFILSAAVLFAAFHFYKKELGHFLFFFVTIFGSASFLFALKIFMHRPRPALFSPLVKETSFSFPSGHAMLSVAFFGLLAYLAASTMQTRTARVNIFFAWLFLVFGVGLSRLYLGVHYPTDVIAGYLSGFLWLCIGIYFFERSAKKEKFPSIS